MKKYIMEIMHEQNNLPSGKYKTIVTVDEAGNYHQYNETENINGDGMEKPNGFFKGKNAGI